jgi:hypothetical protein
MPTGRTADVNRPTLTDVMRGIRKHGLIDRMSEECFTFLIGLILEANELGFKNPFTLTVNQALPIGGGNNRQTLHGRRKSLAKVKINGRPIVKIKAGNKGRNSAASYEIDYNLLCTYNGVWQGRTDLPSNLFDSSSDGSPYGSSYGSLTIPRSEEKREEEKQSPDTQNVSTKQSAENNESAIIDGLDKPEHDRAAPTKHDHTTIEKPAQKTPHSTMQPGHIESTIELRTKLGKAISAVWKLDGVPGDMAIQKAMDEFRGDHRPLFNACKIQAAKEKQPNITGPAPALKYILKVAKGNGNAIAYPQYYAEQAITKADALKELDAYIEEREAVLAAPESDFTSRRIDRAEVLRDIDAKITYYQQMADGG